MGDILRKLRKSRIVSLIQILLFIAVCAAVGAFVAYFEHENDPTDEAAKYFRAFIAGDYDTMYDCVYKQDNYYINKNMYKEQMKQIRQNYVIDTYLIGKPEKANGQKIVTVTCKDETSDTEKNFNINLVGVRKKYSISSKYYVDIEKMLVKNFSVVLNEDSELLLNHEKVTEKNAKVTHENGNKIYNFGAIINGQYVVTATTKYYSANESITLNREGTIVDLTKSKITASSDFGKKLNQTGNDIIEQFYAAVRNRKPNSKKLIKYFKTKKLQNKVKKLVKESQDFVYPPDTKNIDTYKVTEMDIKDFIESISYDQSKHRYIVNYSYYYKYKSETSISLANSYVYSLSGKVDCTLRIIYDIENDDIVVSDITLNNKHKKNKK